MRLAAVTIWIISGFLKVLKQLVCMHLIVTPPSFALLQGRIRTGMKTGQTVKFTMDVKRANTNSGVLLIGTLLQYQYQRVSVEFQAEHFMVLIN